MTVTEPGEYILIEPKGPNAMVLAFTRAPDGRIQHHYYGRQDSMQGIRLMAKLGVDSRNFGPGSEEPGPDEPTED